MLKHTEISTTYRIKPNTKRETLSWFLIFWSFVSKYETSVRSHQTSKNAYLGPYQISTLRLFAKMTCGFSRLTDSQILLYLSCTRLTTDSLLPTRKVISFCKRSIQKIKSPWFIWIFAIENTRSLVFLFSQSKYIRKLIILN